MTNAFKIANRNGATIIRRGNGNDFEAIYSCEADANMAASAIEAADAGFVFRMGTKIGVFVKN